MSSSGQNTNNNQAGIIPAGDPNQVIPAGTVGNNPQSTLNPNGKFIFLAHDDRHLLCI
jgi:hypothetical protein